MSDLHLLACSLGKLWKVHRRRLPPEVRHPFIELLLAMRIELLPIPGLSPEINLDRARYDVRRLADLLRLAALPTSSVTPSPRTPSAAVLFPDEVNSPSSALDCAAPGTPLDLPRRPGRRVCFSDKNDIHYYSPDPPQQREVLLPQPSAPLAALRKVAADTEGVSDCDWDGGMYELIDAVYDAGRRCGAGLSHPAAAVPAACCGVGTLPARGPASTCVLSTLD